MARNEVELLEMGQRIKELREANGFKQQWIADQVGVQLRTYQFWQAGKSPPEQESLEKLAKLFGVTPKYILRGDTPDLATASEDDRLIEIDKKLDQLIDRIAKLTDAVQARPDLRQEIHQAFEDYASRLGSQVGKRPPRSQRSADHRVEEPPAAA